MDEHTTTPADDTMPPSVPPSEPPALPTVTPSSPRKQPLDPKMPPHPIPISPSRPSHRSQMGVSPSRLRSSSPRMHSPASSEIFERNVQEPVPISTLQGELSPAHIPTHVMTEDMIPPALEASTQAITSKELNPDEVEIVTSTAHQPAAVSVLEASSSHADLTVLHSHMSPLHQVRSEDSDASMQQSGFLPTSGAPEEDGASNYGSLDPNDVRRLSFISFADVVQSEHQHGETGLRDGLPPSSLRHERAASPLRTPHSPASMHATSGGVTTPPPGVSISPAEQSPVRSTPAMVGSPVSQHGELTIETMRQAVRKTASGDLQGMRAAGMSPVSDETPLSSPLGRTNT